MKLTIKDIAGHLACNSMILLKKDYHSNDWSNYDIGTLVQAHYNKFEDILWLGIDISQNHFACYEAEQFKLLLHPFDLTKEILYKSEIITPARWFRDNYALFNVTKEDMEKLVKMVIYVFQDIKSAPAWFIDQCYEFQLDVNSLIPLGFALDMFNIKVGG